MQADPQVLYRELNASPGSFIAALRFDLKWDNHKFVELCWALHDAAKQNRGEATVPRGVSQLFWYCGTFVPFWIEQRDFRVGQPAVDLARAMRLLRLLGNDWFGEGELSTDAEIGKELAAITQNRIS
jgi:hypothetical protein